MILKLAARREGVARGIGPPQATEPGRGAEPHVNCGAEPHVNCGAGPHVN
jgi:hypothetical protein